MALPLVAVDTLHASAFIVTVLTAGTWLPWLFLGLAAGAWVDRLPRRPVMLLCDVLSFTAFISIPIAAWLGVLSVAQLVAVALLAGGTSVFFRAAYRAYLPAIIDTPDLTEGNAKLTGSSSAAQVGGPGLGGAIAQLAGATTGMLADAVSFAVSFACLASINAEEAPRRANSGNEPHLAREVLQGLQFVLLDPFLRAMLLFGASANFFLTGMNALEVVFLVRTVGVGAGAVGLVLGAVSIGGLIGATLARSLGRRWGSCRTALLAVTLGLPFALLLPLTTSGTGLLLWIAGLLIVDGCVVISNVLTSSFQQTYVPPDMLGRVSACTMTASYSMMPAGALVAGVLAETLGTRASLWVFTAGIAASGGVYIASSRMRHTRDFPSASASPRMTEPRKVLLRVDC